MATTITISTEDMTMVRELREEKNEAGGEDGPTWTNDEIVAYIFKVARGRLNALRKDNHRRANGKPPVHREVKVKVLDAPKPKAAKPAKAPKAAKPAKAPKAAKPAKAPKAPKAAKLAKEATSEAAS